MRKGKIISIGLVGFVAIISMIVLALVNTKSSFSVTEGTNPCLGVIIKSTNQTEGTSITPLSGVTTINVSVPTYIMPNNVTMSAATQTGNVIIGRAQAAEASETNTIWKFIWDTSLWPSNMSGTNNLMKMVARIVYNGGTTPCDAVSTSQYFIQKMDSTVTASLKLTANPTYYEEVAGSGSVKEFNVIASVSPIDGLLPNISGSDPNIFGYFEWQTSTNIGILSPKNSDFLSSTGVMYWPGSVPGNNTITSTVRYGGALATANIDVLIKEKITETTDEQSGISPNNTEPTNTSPSETEITKPSTTSELSTVTQITSSQIKVSEISKSCIENAITKERSDAIQDGTSRPTSVELTKITSCFATSNYILPSNFSPVDPAKIDAVTVDTTSLISKIENSTKTDSSGKNVQTLKFSGKAKPRSIVMIYIFSDPLIITTTSDENGNWQYTLEDPLVPGKHEVYTVINKGDGTYRRSDPLAFLISTASATAANPNGLSLKLAASPAATAKRSDSNLIYYIAASVVAVTIAIISLFIAIRIHLKHRPVVAVSSDIVTSDEIATASIISSDAITNTPKNTIGDEKIGLINSDITFSTEPIRNSGEIPVVGNTGNSQESTEQLNPQENKIETNQQG